jgi:hypothetical protein
VAEVGRGMRGNVARLAKRECDLVANRIVPPETQRTSECARLAPARRPCLIASTGSWEHQSPSGWFER